MEKRIYDVIVVGAGMAGMTAAIYAKRAGKTVLVLEGKAYGGQIVNTFDIANWPGSPGISGVDLSKRTYEQMKSLGVEVRFEQVISIKDVGETKEVETDEDVYSGRTLILAVGSIDREMEIPREKDLAGHGVSYCATCDGAFYKSKDVAVVGGGNTAFYDALYLSDVAEKVYLIHRRDSFKADAALVEKVRAKDNIEFVLEAYPVALVGEEKVESLVVESKVGKQELPVAGVFVAIGKVPATKMFSGLVELDEKGYVVAGEDCHTSCTGVFAAGDCRTKITRQLVTAASDGAVAANEAAQYLE